MTNRLPIQMQLEAIEARLADIEDYLFGDADEPYVAPEVTVKRKHWTRAEEDALAEFAGLYAPSPAPWLTHWARWYRDRFGVEPVREPIYAQRHWQDMCRR